MPFARCQAQDPVREDEHAAYTNGTSGAALELHNMKAGFEQMNKTVKKLKTAKKG